MLLLQCWRYYFASLQMYKCIIGILSCVLSALIESIDHFEISFWVLWSLWRSSQQSWYCFRRHLRIPEATRVCFVDTLRMLWNQTSIPWKRSPALWMSSSMLWHGFWNNSRLPWNCSSMLWMCSPMLWKVSSTLLTYLCDAFTCSVNLWHYSRLPSKVSSTHWKCSSMLWQGFVMLWNNPWNCSSMLWMCSPMLWKVSSTLLTYLCDALTLLCESLTLLQATFKGL
jgi:hypothetical protein